MTKDFIIIWAAMLAVGVAAWSFSGDRQSTKPMRTEAAARIIADDPALKLYSEKSPYMRNER
ncbi:hypothetical protein [Bradyrhizobium sp.]|uniref:hypothetical protein n=1 Tax=Bradyrhizobium sp. TaxID=376 RepID=UPI002B70EBE7|nr:hypothetical protein [Bradyrhizobium sp.]HMM90005.1 hypothetical protein [Bradyrhizobium sp.]